MIASLPMYWREENADLWRAFWDHAQAAHPGLPDLTPPDQIPEPWTDHWLREDLILSATCSLPFRSVLRDRVTYVGTLGHSVTDQPGYYLSKVIRRPDVTHPVTLAYSEPLSHSGWAVTRNHPALAEVTRTLETGSHAASLAAVVEGSADVAMIDAITWRILERFDPNAARVTVSDESTASPGHALITAKGNDPAPLRAAMDLACRTFRAEDPQKMGGLLSFHVLDETLYHALPIPPAPGA